MLFRSEDEHRSNGDTGPRIHAEPAETQHGGHLGNPSRRSHDPHRREFRLHLLSQCHAGIIAHSQPLSAGQPIISSANTAANRSGSWLLAEGRKIASRPWDGPWCEVDTPEDLQKAAQTNDWTTPQLRIPSDTNPGRIFWKVYTSPWISSTRWST